MKQFLKYGFFLSLILLLSGCVKEEWQETGGSCTEGETTVKVTLRMPASSTPKTYALSDADENQVETIDVLAFNTDGYAYKAEATAIIDMSNSADGAKKQFTVKLNKKQEQQTFVFLANVRSQLEDLGTIAVGADKDELLARLVFENAGSWAAKTDGEETFTLFPFWGETNATIDDATTELNGLKLLRGIARLDITLNANVQNFVLNEIYVYNSKNKGQVVPAPGNLDGTDKVTAATVPAGEINNDAPLKYMVPDAMNRQFERSIYLFESKVAAGGKSSDATCLVVGGTFGNDAKPTYYRIDFFKKGKDGKTIVEFSDILRNYRYHFNIKKVAGSGYETPDEAFKAKPVNMIVEITDWDDNYTDIESNGQYFLKAGTIPGELSGDASYGNRIMVNTDYPDGWKATVTGGADWLTLQMFAGTANRDSEILFSVKSNLDGTDSRQGVIEIKAGNITKQITVTQTVLPELSLEITTLDGKPVTSLSFAAKSPAEQKIGVTWKPSNATCYVSMGTTKGNGVLWPYMPQKMIEGDVIVPINNVGDISDADITKDPLFENESVLSFSVTDNSGRKIVKSIILSQIHYGFVATEYDTPYVMDGTVKSFKIRTNMPWKLKNTYNAMLPRFGKAKGGATNGEQDFTFTILDRLNQKKVLNDATQLSFVPDSNDPAQTFDEVTVNLKGITGLKFTHESITYIADFEDIHVNNAPIMDYTVANRECAKIGTGWRLPTENELTYGQGALFDPYSDGGLVGAYWTSTKAPLGGYKYVNLPNRESKKGIITDFHYARAVYGPVK